MTTKYLQLKLSPTVGVVPQLRTVVCELHLPVEPPTNDHVFIFFFQNSESECVVEESEDLLLHR